MKIYQSVIASVGDSKIRQLEGIKILSGSLYIALLAQIEIPLFPIPMTLHTFAIFTMALFQKPKTSCLSVIVYLLGATMGLPVFPNGYVDPFWLFGFSAGYCLSFPIAAYLLATQVKKSQSPFSVFTSLCLVQMIIYLMGTGWLMVQIGWQQAIMMGIIPFLLSDFLKICTAFAIKMTTKHLKTVYHNLISNEEK